MASQNTNTAEMPKEEPSTGNPPLDQRTLHEQDPEKGAPDGNTTGTDPHIQHKSASSSSEPPPNGGLKAWLQVVGGFVLFFNTWGILNTFGVYQTYYESGQLFKASSSDISWIGSIQSFFLLLTGLFSGPVYDRGHLRLLLLVGSFLIVLGHMMLSLCHASWQALLAQGFVIGIGSGCLFVPAVAILPTYFSSKMATAMGIAASGSSLGGIIYPIVFYRLIPRIGFPWAVRVLGFMALGTLLIPIMVMQIRVKPPKARALIDSTAFKDLHFMIFVFGSILGFAGLYVGLFYLSYFGQATGITDDSLSFYLVPILNAASVFGRTLPNILADKIGPLNVITPGESCSETFLHTCRRKDMLEHDKIADINPGAMIVSIVLFCLLAVNATGGLIVSVIFFGFFSGVFIALPAVCLVALTADKTKIGTRIGMGTAMIGVGVLIGGPGGGGILQRDSNKLDWTGTWAFTGAMTMAAGLVFLALRIMRVGVQAREMLIAETLPWMLDWFVRPGL